MLTADESAFLQGMSTANLETIANAPASQWDVSPMSESGTPGYRVGLAVQMTNPDGSTYPNWVWSWWRPLTSQDAAARPAELAAAAKALITQREADPRTPAIASAVAGVVSAVSALAAATGSSAPDQVRAMVLGGLRLAIEQDGSIPQWLLEAPLFQGAAQLYAARPGMPGPGGLP